MYGLNILSPYQLSTIHYTLHPHPTPYPQLSTVNYQLPLCHLPKVKSKNAECRTYLLVPFDFSLLTYNQLSTDNYQLSIYLSFIMPRDKLTILYQMINRQRQYHDIRSNIQDERITHLEHSLVRIVTTLSDQIDGIEARVNQLETKIKPLETQLMKANTKSDKEREDQVNGKEEDNKSK